MRRQRRRSFAPPVRSTLREGSLVARSAVSCSGRKERAQAQTKSESELTWPSARSARTASRREDAEVCGAVPPALADPPIRRKRALAIR
eukprot:2037283-Rhodomonas_salina.1